MKEQCPSCRYDLSGLDGVQLCPECGEHIESAAVVRAWISQVKRRWSYFYLSPILALPGLIFFGVGQPILSVVLGTIFGYRALSLDVELFGGDSTRVGNACQAVAMSVSWTVVTTALLAFAVAVIIAGTAP